MSCQCHVPSGLLYAGQKSQLKVSSLRCEYLFNPLGIDVIRPRLSWELPANDRQQEQTAYRILVASTPGVLASDKGDIWDSGKVTSSATNGILYGGPLLESRKSYYWKVKVWDEGNASTGWSEVNSWSAGLLHPADWTAQWIGAPPQNIAVDLLPYEHRGYHSSIESQADAAQSVVIDLGASVPVDAIQLYPATLPGKEKSPYLFPVRFALEICGDSLFQNAVRVVDETSKDFTLPSVAPYIGNITPTTGRYVRITAVRLSEKTPGAFAFALAEAEVYSKHVNVALHKPVSTGSVFRMGAFENNNWEKERLTDGFRKPNSNPQYNLPVPPSPLLRKGFTTEKEIGRAMLYITALGLYEARVNGQKVGRQLLAPEYTDYRKRVQYQTYDVTALVRAGRNMVGVMLADGWYAGALFSHPDRGSYGFDRRLLAQLEITYGDGTTTTVATDATWEILENGPVRKASLYDGEEYDASFNPAKWDEPNTAHHPAKQATPSAWQKVTVDTTVNIAVSAQMNEPICVVEELKPLKIFEPKKGVYIFDMGQNMVGWCKLALPYNPGHTITLRHAEVLQADSTLYTDNLRGAKQTDRYMPASEASIAFEPRFTYHGFRFVEVTGLTKRPELNALTGMVIASAAATTGTFACSSESLNQLWKNIFWTQRGNLHSIPTDCPQRDERAGWMGDAQVFSQTAIYNMDMAAFFTKWVRDIRDSQTPDGRFPDFTPQPAHWMSFYDSPGWSDAGVIVPWRLYLNYADTTVLMHQFGAMKKYIDLIASQNPTLVWRNVVGNAYGDWLNGDGIIGAGYPRKGGAVPADVYATAFFAYSTRLVAQTAKILGKQTDYVHYDMLANAIRDTFQKQFVTDKGEVKGNTQAGYALALEFDLVPEKLRPASAALMVKAIEQYDFRISTGIQTTIRMMNQLSKNGYADEAYRLLISRRFPSWLYSVDQGATTIWERWDGYVQGRGFQDKGMNSFNHYAIGAAGEWMYSTILGIRPDERAPGYKHFFIEPIPGGGLTFARGRYHSIAGPINVDWKKDRSKFYLSVSIPANTSATITLPKGVVTESGKPVEHAKGIQRVNEDKEASRQFLVSSGNYRFVVTLEKEK